MPENNKTDSQDAPKHDEDKKDSQRGLWMIIGVGIVVLLIVIIVGAVFVDSQKIRFITEFSLTVALATLVGVQAYIYRRQWEAMQGQLVEMKLQHVTNQGQIMIAAMAVEAAERSAKAAEESVHLMTQSQRPDIALGLKFGVLEVGKRIPFEFEVFNAGKETAYNFGIHIACEWKPAGFDGVLDYGKPKHEATEPIRPQSRKYVYPHWFYPLQPHEFFTLMNGTVWLFVYGILWYEDGAGKRYSEPFCRRFDHGSPQDAVECPYSIRERMVEEPE